MKKLTMQFPFMGFYESVHSGMIDSELESTVEYDAESLGMDSRELFDIRWQFVDYGDAKKEYLGKFFAEFIKRLENELAYYIPEDSNGMKKLVRVTIPAEFEKMESPKFYNFETDRLFVTIPAEFAEKMRHDVTPLTFKSHIEARHTSRDGFASFYSANWEEWKDKPPAEFDHNELMTLFLAWLDDQGIDESKLNEIELDSAFECTEAASHAVNNATNWPAYETALKESNHA